MIKFLKITSLLCILISTTSFAQNKVKRTKEMLDSLMIKEHIPGLAYSIVKNGKIISTETLGKASIPFDVNVNEKTAFQLASVSKIYTAILLGRLFDEGILKPDTKLIEVFDSIPKSWNNISILELSSHQSGIKIGDFSKSKTGADALKIAMTMPFEFETGTKSSYVSSDYWILLAVIEKATGLKYYEALKKYVLTPLSLNNTYVNNPKTGYITDLDIIPQQAQEYHWFNKDKTLRVNQMWFKETDYAAGGIYSSITDMTKIAQMFDKKEFLKKGTYDLIENPVKLKDGKDGSYGLALIVRDYEGHKIVEHSGGPALADFIRFEKEGYTFIVLTNNRGVYPYLAKAIATVWIDGLNFPKIPEGWE